MNKIVRTMKLKALLLLLGVGLLASSCAQRTCPSYAQDSQPATPIKKEIVQQKHVK